MDRAGAISFRLVLVAFSVMLVTGCTGVNNAAGTATAYGDPGTAGTVQGLGIESQDVVSMTDQMMRDMLAEPRLARQTKSPNVIIDGEYFQNASSTRIDKNIITDRLRVSLNRAARGRMVFIARHHAGMVEHERRLKRDAMTDGGTQGQVAATKGGDYRLGGRITSLDSANGTNGMRSRYTQIVFEMVDLESSEIVWSGSYEFSKTNQDDVVYR